ncbi:MAG: response regulator transcription factor [Deltaproteobacteria bacterium]|nr:response regulator transcription factor [Deltaproteobacteria bacterium]
MNAPDTSQARVLVCDDDPDARALISSTMTAAGYNVVEAGDGAEAQEICLVQLPDVIVMDIMMPKMTGMEFLAWFREAVTDPYVPVLLLTALDQVDNRVAGLAQGADDYVTKPFHYRELQARVEALLRVRSLNMSLRERSRELERSNQELHKAQAMLLQNEREMVAARMAGAAAHNLGQPLTTLFLNLYILEKYFAAQDASLDAVTRESIEAMSVIRAQCGAMKEILSKLRALDPEKTRDYVGETKIFDIESKG